MQVGCWCAPPPGYFAWRGRTLEIKPASSFRTQEGGKPELNQCHVTWFKAANSMLPGAWEMQGDSSFYQWQCVGLACWFPSQFPASSEGWALQETDSRLPPLLTATALSSTPLCFVFQLTGQRERRQCAGSRAQADTFFWRPSSLSIPPLSIVLCLPFPFLSLPFSSVLGLWQGPVVPRG